MRATPRGLALYTCSTMSGREAPASIRSAALRKVRAVVEEVRKPRVSVVMPVSSAVAMS